MEIAIVGSKSFKIKSKNTSFIFNPEKKIDEDVVMLTSKPDDYNTYEGKLVIDSPGDYETAGVSIKSEKNENGICFELFEDGQRVVVFSSPKLASTQDTADASAVVSFIEPETSHEASQITCDIVVLVCSEDSLPQDKSNIKKIDKLNLKKTDEYKGLLIHLSK